jgi:hypothetical protein
MEKNCLNALVVGLCQNDAAGHLGEVAIVPGRFGYALQGIRRQGAPGPDGSVWTPDIHDMRVGNYGESRYLFWLAAFGNFPEAKPHSVDRFKETLEDYKFLGGAYQQAVENPLLSTEERDALHERYHRLMEQTWERVCDAYLEAVDQPQIRIDGLMSALLDDEARYVNEHQEAKEKLKIAGLIRQLYLEGKSAGGDK